MTATTKTTYIAIDPVTGEKHKRTSVRNFGFATFCHQDRHGSDRIGVGFNTTRELAEKAAMELRTRYGWNLVLIVPTTIEAK